jgi:hypothetical protein
MNRPRRGKRVSFRADEGATCVETADTVTGLRFTIAAQNGGDALIDYTGLKPRRLALAFARALRQLGAPGGPLTVRSTIKAYAATLPRFFAYLAQAGDCVGGPEDLQAHHVDGFEAWLEAEGLSRIHLFTVLVKVIAMLRQVAADLGVEVSVDLRDRLRYVSAKPAPKSKPRDAYSPFVARQLRDAARADIQQLFRRFGQRSTGEHDTLLHAAIEAVDAVINARGRIGHKHPAFKSLYFLRMRRGLPTATLIEDVHAPHHLLARDLPPLLVLLSLETGLELECCKTLTVECLRNPSAGTVAVTYLKRRARGAEYKSLRVRDGGIGTPGGLIRRLIEVTAPARRHCPSDTLWVYLSHGRLRSGIDYRTEWTNDWTRRHGIVDDDKQPLRLQLSRLRKTHKALWYRKTEGHMARFAIGHTPEIAARHYADIPSLRPLHEATVASAFEDAVVAAQAPILLSPEQEEDWRASPRRADGIVEPDAVVPLLDGDQDVWLASCAGFYRSPHGQSGEPCPQPFWGCLDCSNAVITARKLPAILAFLAFIEEARGGLPAADWQAKFGHVHARITAQVLPAFSERVIADARAELGRSPLPIYLPPEARV